MISDQIDKAIAFAAKAHQDHYRKSSKIPYITHPFAVAMILHQQACSEAVVIAGLLHDTVEDTPVTLTDIHKAFGARVAAIVDGCTEPEKSKPWHERKQYMVDILEDADVDIKYVVCADKLHNLITMERAFQSVGDQLWDRFSRGYQDQKWYYNAMVDTLFSTVPSDQMKPMFYELKRKVESFINEQHG